MKFLKSIIWLITILAFQSCFDFKHEDETIPEDPIQITSPEFIDGLLFVNSNNFQIQTNVPVTFSSSDAFVKISPDGLIKRLTSAEVVAIDVTSVEEPE